MTVPFRAFNFSVEIDVPHVSEEVCTAAFSECDGLEMTMDVKTLKEGGNNATLHRLAGPVSYGQVTLKRGMTDAFDLWRWFASVQSNPALRGNGEVVLLAEDGVTERASWVLERCLPLKLKAPPLNARDGTVAIEEFQLACDSIRLNRGARA